MFNLIDYDNWDRKEAFEIFAYDFRSYFSITVNLEISTFKKYLKENNLKFYASIIYMIAKCVNCHKNFRFDFDSKGRLGFYDKLDPTYILFNKENKNFINVYTPYNDDFSIFYKDILADMEKYKDLTVPYANKTDSASFTISCLPWISYSSLDMMDDFDGKVILQPLISFGKYFELADKLILPFTLRIHHAVCDGYHASVFINDLQDYLNNPEKYFKNRS